MLVSALAQVARADPPAARTELGAFPLLGGDTDLGFGGGGFGSLARFDPGYTPYHYRIELAGAITFKSTSEGLRAPYQDIYVLIVLPELVPGRMRLELRPSYTRENNLGYYGVGNAVPAPERGPQGQPAQDYYQYGMLHPSLQLRLRLTLFEHVSLQLGELLTYQHADVHPGSLLAQDLARGALGSARPHFVNVLEYTVLFDTRDAETSTRRGMFHQLRVRLSPGGVQPFPYRYGSLNLIARTYHSYRRFTLALRVVGDALFGDAPFYELPRFEDTFALGGANGVRGVPAQRYAGKLKLFGNVELRVKLLRLRLLGLDCELHGVGFFDAGRLWSDLPVSPAADGGGLGLKWGSGLGLRLQQGQAFVVRADLAYSPDARPLGAYVTAGQLF